MKNSEEKNIKICTQCKIEKELKLFYNRKLSNGNITKDSWCKSCRRDYKEKNRKTPRKRKFIKKCDNENNKICYNCELEKPLIEFNKGKGKCKECRKKYYENNNGKNRKKHKKAIDDVNNKICIKCNIEKPLEEFNNTTRKNGKIAKQSICRICSKVYQDSIKLPPKVKEIKNTKICTKCKVEKSINDFYIRKRKNGKEQLSPRCKKCENLLCNEWRKKNPEKIKESNLSWRNKNAETIFDINFKICSKCKLEKSVNEFHKILGNKFNLSHYCKQCRSIIRKESHNKNKSYYNAYSRNYMKMNRSKVNKNNLKRIKANPILKLRQSISSKIYYTLKINDSSKNGSSIFDYLPYTIDELKKHIESQWIGEKSWMNWDNYGKYYIGGPKRWHLDHIEPKSIFLFDSLDHPNFLKCWSLDNLQPLEAVENMQKHNKINFYKNE